MNRLKGRAIFAGGRAAAGAEAQSALAEALAIAQRPIARVARLPRLGPNMARRGAACGSSGSSRTGLPSVYRGFRHARFERGEGAPRGARLRGSGYGDRKRAVVSDLLVGAAVMVAVAATGRPCDRAALVLCRSFEIWLTVPRGFPRPVTAPDAGSHDSCGCYDYLGKCSERFDTRTSAWGQRRRSCTCARASASPQQAADLPEYGPRHAAYDLKKLRGKHIIRRIGTPAATSRS
jgi:hypothetical protein